ncbi:MAG: hypothetical protein WAM97_18700 [Acidimicrobiales bacterium]
MTDRLRKISLVAALCGVVVGTAACGSSGSAGGTTTTTVAIHSTCQDIAAVLSDGPDPGADPVGYALAQVSPLRQIHTSDASLQRAVDNLASAYEEVYKTNGSKAANDAVTQASNRVNAICPGAAS